ncbi:MAG: ComEC/Rec2 family competence protein [Olsenella sp.]|nr:ComEC/Rec2 family competence protein [Olsenella sp.]
MQGFRSRARATDGRGGTCDIWLTTDGRLAQGSVVRGVGRFRENGDDEWGDANRLVGVVGSVRMVRIVSVDGPTGLTGMIAAAREAVVASFRPEESEGGALLAGSICGVRDYMDDSGLDDLFSTCGVAHLVAVSGGHIAIVSSIVSLALERTRLGPRTRTMLLLGVSGAFVVFCGAPISAVRSWFMSALAFGSLLSRRRGHALSAVCIVALGMALFDPHASGGLGFTLSVTSVIALCLFRGYASYVIEEMSALPRTPRHRHGTGGRVGDALDFAKESLAATLVCQVATIPITCPVFSEFSIVAPVANVVLALPFTALVGLGFVGALLVGTPLSSPVVWVATRVGDACSSLLKVMAQAPCASVHLEVDAGFSFVALVLAAGALLVIWPRVSRGAVLAVVAGVALACGLLVARWRFFADARVCVLDVGQGDAILVQDGASAVLVDAGPDERVLSKLSELHVMHLDAVIVTHLHDDHYGGLDDLAGKIPCDRVVVADGVRQCMSDDAARCVSALVGTRVDEVALGDVLRVGSFSLEVVWPTGGVDGSENSHSLELLLCFDGGARRLSGLLTGDAEREETRATVDAGRVGDVDFLKVGHHGSSVSIDVGSARAIDPEVSVASAGKDNRYGHPSPECIEVLEGAGSVFLCTKDVGTVTLCPGESGPIVSTERGDEAGRVVA